MNKYDIKDYIKSDVIRYRGKFTVKNFLGLFVFNKGFRVTFCFRMAQSQAFGNRVALIMGFYPSFSRLEKLHHMGHAQKSINWTIFIQLLRQDLRYDCDYKN